MTAEKHLREMMFRKWFINYWARWREIGARRLLHHPAVQTSMLGTRVFRFVSRMHTYAHVYTRTHFYKYTFLHVPTCPHSKSEISTTGSHAPAKARNACVKKNKKKYGIRRLARNAEMMCRNWAKDDDDVLAFDQHLKNSACSNRVVKTNQ